ncbi:MAG: hypothetical protein KY428_10440 [Bacteroidetes bacterium]|nr:hypothetical protein [Bacteroidota bacterium]
MDFAIMMFAWGVTVLLHVFVIEFILESDKGFNFPYFKRHKGELVIYIVAGLIGALLGVYVIG